MRADTHFLRVTSGSLQADEQRCSSIVGHSLRRFASASCSAHYAPTEFWIEDVFSSPQMGVVSSFSFGEGKGILKGIAAGRGITPSYITPSVWKRDIGVTAEKRSSILKAKRLFPFQQKMLTSEGKCEAALIALYGLLTSGEFNIG
ncbi:crossover junction endodeoxyribonuclease RuvC [Hyphomicrobium sp. NDB2Meth4]|uniref:crossover junction endodeoxyribonuclease RuvC n=1 Tax=Hyphomicrobium sp. NDB2Meth4 TaxID=1892846 RepID=UPI001114C1DF|nr:crossover junction endodeoxyribonuclease RuvC [Hyphomicrobium sp. NDB2Meth4]